MTRVGGPTPPKDSGPHSGKSQKKPAQDSPPQKKVDAQPDRKTVPNALQAELFHEKLQLAQKKGKKPDLPAEEGKALLVILHPTGHHEQPSAPSAVETPAGNQGSEAQRVEWLESLCTRIDHALLSIPRTPDGRFTLALQLTQHGTEGLHGVELSMSPMALDVVLSRTGGQASVEFLAATQALAERLQEKFPKRVIRIHEVASSAATSRKRGADPVNDSRTTREGGL